jgi:hypothetical protein
MEAERHHKGLPLHHVLSQSEAVRIISSHLFHFESCRLHMLTFDRLPNTNFVCSFHAFYMPCQSHTYSAHIR